ncbi:MAG TPA: ABC transporter substrate-binding protein, partial [Syntrophomonas sp.]|nr:ABC transporter substrate-binding protein [Syntrophomonas sp.]
MKKKVVALLMVLVMALAIAGCGKSDQSDKSAASKEIKVGALFNQTGDQSSLDVPGLNGFKLAVDEINKKGGINGSKITLVAIDGKTDQTACANAASKMVDVDKVVAISGLADSNYA